MAQLIHERCVACRPGSPSVTDVEVAEISVQVPDWDLVREDGIRKLQRIFKFKDFKDALDFTCPLYLLQPPFAFSE